MSRHMLLARDMNALTHRRRITITLMRNCHKRRHRVCYVEGPLLGKSARRSHIR